MVFYYIEVNNFLSGRVVGDLSDMDTRNLLGGDGSLF
jgi:hypothetical protein